jgi:hypothetical protein
LNPEALGIPPQTSISIAWIDLDAQEAKLRMEKRGDPRDQWKLMHWDQYATRRIDPPEHQRIKRCNNKDFDEAKFLHLIEDLLAI